MRSLEKPFTSSFNSSKYYREGEIAAIDAYFEASQEKVEILIEAFRDAIEQGFNPNNVAEQIYKQLKISPNDLLDHDQQRLKVEVEEIYHSVRRYF